MKIKTLIIWFIVLGAIASIVYGISAYATIFNGYAAKEVCSCIYLAGRDQLSIEENDLNSFFVGLPTNVWDKDARTVTSSFLGLSKQTAVYRDGLGCALVAEADIKDVRKQSYHPRFPNYAPDTVYWPIGNKMRDTIPPAIQITKL